MDWLRTGLSCPWGAVGDCWIMLARLPVPGCATAGGSWRWCACGPPGSAGSGTATGMGSPLSRGTPEVVNPRIWLFSQYGCLSVGCMRGTSCRRRHSSTDRCFGRAEADCRVSQGEARDDHGTSCSSSKTTLHLVFGGARSQGASSGLGRSLALAAARCQAKLVLTARRADALEEVRDLCVAAGCDGEPMILVADLAGDPVALMESARAVGEVATRLAIGSKQSVVTRK